MAPRPRIFSPFTRRLECVVYPSVNAFALVTIGLFSCSTPSAQGTKTPDRSPVVAAARNVELAGHRCVAAAPGTLCRCRGAGDDTESEPPQPGYKRFEIRMSASGGRIAAAADALGRFEVQGAQTRCLYVDLLTGSTTKLSVTATADDKTTGVLPEFSLAEYGPSGPFWYETLNVQCQGKYGQCDRQGADTWQDSLSSRKRGRVDPCGSAVVKSLRWDTSGSQSARDGEFFHDFTVSFDMEIKSFATRFAPGSTECVPK